jgi:molybdate transport system substrate-binding protein
VETGEADAALVYSTDAKFAKHVKLVAQTEPEGPVKISYGIALTKQGAAKSIACELENFITGNSGKEIFKNYGFLP